MEKAGRNDPCPCGSGKKYKKCHLAEDAASPAPKAAPKPLGMALGESFGFPDTENEDGLFEPDRMEEEIDAELDDLLHEVDFPDMVRLLRAYIPKAELESAYFTQGFFERVWDAAETLQDRDAYRELLPQLGRENPDSFAEIGGALILDILEQTVADGRKESLATLFLGYAVLASRDPDFFMGLADGMAYYGFLDALVKGMRKGWPNVRDSKLLSPATVEQFARRAILYEVCSAMEASSHMDATEMGVKIRNFLAWEEGEIEKYIEHMSGSRSELPTPEDFSVRPEAWRRNPEALAAFQGKLKSLAHAFRGFLRIEKGVSWPQADLAAAEIQELLLTEWEDPSTEEPDWEDVTDRVQGSDRKAESDQEGGRADTKQIRIRNLCPESDILEAFLGEKIYELELQDFRARALMANLSHWLELLVRSGLIEQTASHGIWESWKPTLEMFANAFEDLLIPPSAVQSTPPA